MTAVSTHKPTGTTASSVQAVGFYQDLLNDVSDGVYFVTPDRVITWWNRGAERLTGYSAEEVIGRGCRDGMLNHCDDRGIELCRNGCPLEAVMQDGRTRQAQVWMHHRDGHRQPVWVRAVAVHDSTGKITGAVEIFGDDTAAAAVRERMASNERSQWTDSVTGTGTRQRLEVELPRRIEEQARYGWSCAALRVEVKDLQPVSDRYGDDVTQQVLRMVARTLTSGCRPCDMVFRSGQEDFVLLLPNLDEQELAAGAERLRALVERSSLHFGSETVRVDVTMGGTFVEEGDTTPAVLYRAGGAMRTRTDDRVWSWIECDP